MAATTTTVRLERATVDLLRKLGRKGDTYDRVIRKLIAEAQGMGANDFKEIEARLKSDDFIPAGKIPWERLQETAHINEIKRKILPILRRRGVTKAAVFGSFVRGENKEGSDLDLLVELEEDKSLLDLAGLKVDLEETLKMKVDVVTYGSLHPLLKDRILSEQEVIV